MDIFTRLSTQIRFFHDSDHDSYGDRDRGCGYGCGRDRDPGYICGRDRTGVIFAAVTVTVTVTEALIVAVTVIVAIVAAVSLTETVLFSAIVSVRFRKNCVSPFWNSVFTAVLSFCIVE